jgi:hypothetical protein
MKLLILAFFLLPACATPCSQLYATRCDGTQVQICGSNNRWQRVLECSQLKAIKLGAATKWQCGASEGAHTCIPVQP